MGIKYYDSRPDSGYYVGYKVKVLEKVDFEKPTGFRFPQLGWLRVDNEIASTWFNRQPIEDTNTLNDNVLDGKESIWTCPKYIDSYYGCIESTII